MFHHMPCRSCKENKNDKHSLIFADFPKLFFGCTKWQVDICQHFKDKCGQVTPWTYFITSWHKFKKKSQYCDRLKFVSLTQQKQCSLSKVSCSESANNHQYLVNCALCVYLKVFYLHSIVHHVTVGFPGVS